MSAQAVADPLASSAATKSKKKKNKKKNNSGAKGEANGDAVASNGAKEAADNEDDGDEDPEPETPGEPEVSAKEDSKSHAGGVESSAQVNGVGKDTSERLAALAKERDALREEVSELRKSLEALTAKHEEEVREIKEQLEETQSGREEAESKYEDLRERVTTIRTTLGERLKEYSAEITQQRTEIESLQELNATLKANNESLQSEISRLTAEHSNQAREINDLRGRVNLSQQNWVKERDELIQREAIAREEFETAAQAMKEWEDLANEERIMRKNLEDRVSDLEEEIAVQREAYERAAAERDTQSQAVEGLQRALKEIQDARKKELRELVESSQTQLDALRKQLDAAVDEASSAKAALEQTEGELEKLRPLQQEIREKNLLIGKLKHEAVTLNEHLTKALRFLKKSKPGDTVDRQLVTNHLLQFLAMDRSDPKKFQVLQLIAHLLAWSDEQKEQAGLARPGGGASSSSSTSSSTLRIPSSPFRRTPSTPSLSTQLDNATPASKESLAELWSEFLEREAQEGQASGTAENLRRPSTATELSRRESEKS
ncbi:uncharacterized protein PV09_09044 [Verruconis gallopava]|uniref:GRIP domain-containing protein n=1 Tax=Verruconis gallopava TaxID=253628 RepID=A0A0D1YEW6_9PEZI|nr:uncharacterized protein PV09_09044 [Verruconis gallopava]KIV99276.1 hypothetical protein PV09_09044 [Verruconis gallopava]